MVNYTVQLHYIYTINGLFTKLFFLSYHGFNIPNISQIFMFSFLIAELSINMLLLMSCFKTPDCTIPL